MRRGWVRFLLDAFRCFIGRPRCYRQGEPWGNDSYRFSKCWNCNCQYEMHDLGVGGPRDNNYELRKDGHL